MIKITLEYRRDTWEWNITTPVLSLNGSALSKRDAAKQAADMVNKLMGSSV